MPKVIDLQLVLDERFTAKVYALANEFTQSLSEDQDRDVAICAFLAAAISGAQIEGWSRDDFVNTVAAIYYSVEGKEFRDN